MSVIEIKDLNFIYGQNTPFEISALKDINLNIKKGEFVGLIGHTGSGKSTLIQHFNALIKPTSGTILLDGEDIWADKSKIRSTRFKVGLVFQYPEYQLFEQTVKEDIAFGPTNMGLSEEEINDRVLESIKLVGLNESYLDKSPFDLSGGEKRRVAIAGIMAMQPEVLVLDEPTSGLDPKGRKSILKHIKNYHKETGNTVIIVSHSMEDVASIADKVLVMNDGKIEMFDHTKAVFSNSNRLIEIGLNVPQITKIAIELKKLGIIDRDDIYTIDEAQDILLSLLKEGGKNND